MSLAVTLVAQSLALHVFVVSAISVRAFRRLTPLKARDLLFFVLCWGLLVASYGLRFAVTISTLRTDSVAATPEMKNGRG